MATDEFLPKLLRRYLVSLDPMRGLIFVAQKCATSSLSTTSPLLPGCLRSDARRSRSRKPLRRKKQIFHGKTSASCCVLFGLTLDSQARGAVLAQGADHQEEGFGFTGEPNPLQ